MAEDSTPSSLNLAKEVDICWKLASFCVVYYRLSFDDLDSHGGAGGCMVFSGFMWIEAEELFSRLSMTGHRDTPTFLLDAIGFAVFGMHVERDQPHFPPNWEEESK